MDASNARGSFSVEVFFDEANARHRRKRDRRGASHAPLFLCAIIAGAAAGASLTLSPLAVSLDFEGRVNVTRARVEEVRALLLADFYDAAWRSGGSQPSDAPP
jgi:hypothetical protein